MKYNVRFFKSLLLAGVLGLFVQNVAAKEVNYSYIQINSGYWKISESNNDNPVFNGGCLGTLTSLVFNLVGTKAKDLGQDDVVQMGYRIDDGTDIYTDKHKKN
jgi:hypothetical protein